MCLKHLAWLKRCNKCRLFLKFCHYENHELYSIQRAPFCILQKFLALESQSILKYSNKLTPKALCPINLEKQNINFSSANF